MAFPVWYLRAMGLGVFGNEHPPVGHLMKHSHSVRREGLRLRMAKASLCSCSALTLPLPPGSGGGRFHLVILMSGSSHFIMLLWSGRLLGVWLAWGLGHCERYLVLSSCLVRILRLVL